MQRDIRKFGGFMGLFCTLIVEVALQLYTFVKIQQMFYLKLVDLIVCNLYLNKDDKRQKKREEGRERRCRIFQLWKRG